jgi:hypothetical protein
MAEMTKIVISAIFFHKRLLVALSLDCSVLGSFVAGLMGLSWFFIGENQIAVDSLLRFGYIYVAIN